MKLKTQGKWKTVELDPHLQAKGFAEGLLGIEELPASKYNIDGYKIKGIKDDPKNEFRCDISEGGKYVRKRHCSPEDFDGLPSKKKKRTRQKRKPKDKTHPKYKRDMVVVDNHLQVNNDVSARIFLLH